MTDRSLNAFSDEIPSSQFGGAPEAGGDRVLGVPGYQRVRDIIRSDIARGTLEPDARLKIVGLSERYGLSPAPIREALGQLAAEGWVVIHPNRGARVRDINETFLRELNEIRIAVESYNVALCAAVATRADVALLESIEDEYEASLAQLGARPGSPGDVAPLIAINARLHKNMLAIRPNREAMALMERHGLFFNAMRRVWGYGDYRPRRIAEEHRTLLDAFRRNNASDAESISRQHIANAMDDLLQVWRAGPRSA
jgi:DNA-binding GntR family transcriptional regulator